MVSSLNTGAGIIRDVRLDDIKVNPQTRIRQHSTDFKNDVHYKALKKSMIKFGMLHPLTLDTNMVLIGGFYRFCVATELGWKLVKAQIVDVSDFDKIFIEIIENYHRKDFSSYEFYIGLGRLKKEYEITHPETKHGFGRWQNSNSLPYSKIDGGNKEEIGSVLYPNSQPAPSFVNLHYELIGLTERGLRNKTRIGEAIIDNKFSNKTIRLLQQSRINQKQLLSLLKKTRVRKEITNSINEDIEPMQNKEEKNNVGKPEKIDESIRKAIVDKFVISGKEISQGCGKLHSTLQKKESLRVKKAVIKDSPIEINNIKSIEIREKKPEKREVVEDICRFCQKATVIAVSCEECGHPTPKVMCDDDITKGVSRLRNPYTKKCVDSHE